MRHGGTYGDNVPARGQRLWLASLDPTLVESGRLARLIRDAGVTGVRAPAGLAPRTVTAAANLLAAVHHDSGGRDGLVSVALPAALAMDTEGLTAAATAYRNRLGCPNLMLQIPATRPGLIAIEQLADAGVNVDATLLFSAERYAQAAEAWLLGLESRLRRGQPVTGLAGTAAFTVALVDRLADRCLDEAAAARPDAADALRALHGSLALANAALAWGEHQRLFAAPRFTRLAEAGSAPQQLIWLDTITDNPALEPHHYRRALDWPGTALCLDTATVAERSGAPPPDPDLGAAARHHADLAAAGIDLPALNRRIEATLLAAADRPAAASVPVAGPRRRAGV